MEFAGIGHNRPPKDEVKRAEPDCFCHTCDRWIHHLGIMSHRAAHCRRNERCTITFSRGDTRTWKYDE